MRLLIKQRVFTLTDTYDVYDENGNPKYFVKNELFALLRRVHVTNMNGEEVGVISKKLTLLIPKFDIEIGGWYVGSIEKNVTLLKPKYTINYKGWECKGDLLAWDYDVYSNGKKVVHISKELLHWGDTYSIDIADPEDELMALMLVIAIDAINFSQNNR